MLRLPYEADQSDDEYKQIIWAEWFLSFLYSKTVATAGMIYFDRPPIGKGFTLRKPEMGKIVPAEVWSKSDLVHKTASGRKSRNNDTR